MNDVVTSYPFNRLTLQWADTALEKSFVDGYDLENRSSNRNGTLVGALSWILIIGYAFLFQKNAIPQTVPPVMFLVYPYFLLVISVTFVKRLNRFCQGICALGNLLAGLVAVYLVTVFPLIPHMLTFYVCGYAMGAFFLLRLRFSMAAPITFLYVVVYQITLLLPHHFPPDSIYRNTGAIWLFEAASVVGGYLLEKNVREVFLQNLIIKGQRKAIELEKEKSERLLQKQLLHAERLATLGTVVAGVAHEINNPNNSLMLDAQFNQNAWKRVSAVLDEYVEANDGLTIGGFGYDEFKSSVVDASNRMKRNTERIKHIVEDLQAFARKDADLSDDVDLNAMVRSALSVIEHVTSRYTQNLHVELGASIPRVRGNTQGLEQVVINLVKNACQSLPGPEKSVVVSTAFEPEKNSVSFSVHDQGKGMDEKTLKEIFTPFFTTKSKEGTGLGLSICSNIVKNHGGTIDVKSMLEKGTTITVLLPFAPAPPENSVNAKS